MVDFPVSNSHFAKNLKVGLALGGGGARGAAHIGVLNAFDQFEVSFSGIAGTSSGAIIAVLYAFDVPLDVIHKSLQSMRPVQLGSLKIGKLGFFENTEVERVMKMNLPSNARLEESKVPVAVHSTNIISGHPYSISTGCAIEAVLASCAVPGFYLPVIKDEKTVLVDGGLTENVPLSALDLLSGVNYKIAVNLNGVHSYGNPKGILDVLATSMDIAIDAQTLRQISHADQVLSIDLSEYSRTSNKDFNILRKVGYEKTHNWLADLMSEKIKKVKGPFRQFTSLGY